MIYSLLDTYWDTLTMRLMEHAGTRFGKQFIIGQIKSCWLTEVLVGVHKWDTASAACRSGESERVNGAMRCDAASLYMFSGVVRLCVGDRMRPISRPLSTGLQHCIIRHLWVVRAAPVLPISRQIVTRALALCSQVRTDTRSLPLNRHQELRRQERHTWPLSADLRVTWPVTRMRAPTLTADCYGDNGPRPPRLRPFQDELQTAILRQRAFKAEWNPCREDNTTAGWGYRWRETVFLLVFCNLIHSVLLNYILQFFVTTWYVYKQVVEFSVPNCWIV